MTTESNVSSGAETEITAPVQAETIPSTATEQPEEATTAETPSETQEDREAKAAKALQRRVDRLTRDRYAERARAEQAERELETLRQRVSQPEEKPEVDVQAEAKRMADEMLSQRELKAKVNDVLSKGRSIEGFEAAAGLAVEELGLVDGRGNPTPSLFALLDTDSPAELLHHIGSNPDLAESLSGLSPTRLAVRLAKLEEELKAAKAPKTSAAPKPIKPVGGPAVSSDEYSPSMTNAQFDAWRARQIAARRK